MEDDEEEGEPNTSLSRWLFILSSLTSVLQSEKIHTLIKAEDVSIDSYWLGLFAKLFKDLIFNVGSGGGAAPVAVAAPAAVGGGAAPVFEEKKGLE
ncbi:hypothetical protein QJS10_CPB11g01254 [Acorus calamus]|uniref:Uncharacterized protein n=1 Tax=Acorus calamus TaxID=4465 RepID=A0AAV9DS93_ACOCL|nr:hypothetical protein QJS10_CPB11g01254 [Acorus calamus]